MVVFIAIISGCEHSPLEQQEDLSRYYGVTVTPENILYLSEDIADNNRPMYILRPLSDVEYWKYRDLVYDYAILHRGAYVRRSAIRLMAENGDRDHLLMVVLSDPDGLYEPATWQEATCEGGTGRHAYTRLNTRCTDDVSLHDRRGDPNCREWWGDEAECIIHPL